MELITVKEAMEEYGLSRRKADEMFALCRQLPRVPRGKKYVFRNELDRVMGGENEKNN